MNRVNFGPFEVVPLPLPLSHNCCLIDFVTVTILMLVMKCVAVCYGWMVGEDLEYQKEGSRLEAGKEK